MTDAAPEAPVVAPAARPRRAAAAALAILTFAAGVLRYATEIDDPWDDSLASINGANYTGNIERAFRRAGFAELRGLPYLFVGPTTVRTEFDQPYVHHPPLFRALVHGAADVFGFDERGVRTLPVLAAAAAAALLALLTARTSGLFPAAGASAFFLACPMSWHYGWMANYEAVLLPLTLAGVGLHVLLRRRSVLLYLPVYVVFLAAAQVDWAGLFLGPALGIYELCRPKDDRRLNRVVAMIPLGALSVAGVVAHLAWAREKPFGDAFRDLLTTATHAATGDPHVLLNLGPPRFTTRSWLETIGGHWVSLWTWGGVAAAVAGVLLFAWRRAVRGDATTAVAWALLTPALLNVLLFRQAAFVHEFWCFAALPFVTLSVAEILRGAGRLRGLALLLALALVSFCVARTVEIRTAQERTVGGPKALAAEINRLAGKDDVLLTQADLGQASFYVDAWVTRPMAGPFAPALLLPSVANLVRSGALRVKRAVVLLPDRITEAGAAEAGQIGLIEDVARLGTVTRYAPAEFAEKFPVMSGMLLGAGLARLVIE